MALSTGLADYWPRLLRYPLSGYGLPVLVMLALLMTIAMRSGETDLGLPTTGLPMLLIALIWMVFYTMRIIDHTTRGYATPPPLDGDALYLATAMRPLALPLMLGLSYTAVRAAHPAAAQALVAGAVFVMPAYLFLLATEQRLAAALNPLRWLQLIIVMGWRYALPCLVLALLATGLLRVSGSTALVLLIAAACYGLFVTAHLVGYLGFKRQHALGLQVDVPHPDQAAREAGHRQQLDALLRRLHAWQLEGQEAFAAAAIASHGGGPKDAIAFFEELFRAMQASGKPSLVHAAGRRLITLLLAARQPTRALDIATNCLDAHWHFAPATPTELCALLQSAASQRFETLHDRLLHGAEADAHRDEPAWAEVQFQRALHQSEYRHDDAGALALLQPLRAMKRHPQHARFERLARTLEALEARKPR